VPNVAGSIGERISERILCRISTTEKTGSRVPSLMFSRIHFSSEAKPLRIFADGTTSAKRTVWLTASAVMAAAAVPARESLPERSTGAVDHSGEKAVVRKERKTLDEALRTKLTFQQSSVSGILLHLLYCHARRTSREVRDQMNEIGKTEPITFMVGMSPEGRSRKS